MRVSSIKGGSLYFYTRRYDRRMTIKPFLATAIIAFMSCGTALADNAADITALEAVNQGWAKAFNTADADALAACYDEKAILLPPGSPAVSGRAAIKEWLKKGSEGAVKAGMKFNLTPKPASGISGNMGWLSGTYTVTDKLGGVCSSAASTSPSRRRRAASGSTCGTRGIRTGCRPPSPNSSPLVKRLLATALLALALPAAAERHVYDTVGVLPRIDVPRFEQYMQWIQEESDVDIRLVFVPGLGGRSIEQVATEKMAEMKIGRGTGQERGLLLLFDTRGGSSRSRWATGSRAIFPTPS
jgi:ketosteroid isomerase-like protein